MISEQEAKSIISYGKSQGYTYEQVASLVQMRDNELKKARARAKAKVRTNCKTKTRARARYKAKTKARAKAKTKARAKDRAKARAKAKEFVITELTNALVGSK